MIAALLLLALAAAPPPGPTLTLAAALQRAKANPQLVQALAAERAARQRLDEARAGYLPSASASVGDSLSNSLSPQLGVGTEGGPANLFTSSLQLSETLWDFGRTKAAVDAARAEARSTAADTTLALADLVLNVKSAYFAALASAALEQSARENLASAAKHLEDAQARVEVGKNPPYDETKARIDRGNAELALVQAQNGLQLARAQLAHAIGQELDGAALVEPPAAAATLPSLAQAMTQALAHRPELASLDAQLAADRAAVREAKAAYYPSLGASGEGAVREFAAAGPVTSWAVGAAVSIPLLAGGADRARVGEAEATLDGLEAARSTLVLDVKLDVQSALIAVDGARQAAKVAADVVTEAKEGLALAEGRYDAGAGTIVELTDAQAQLATAKASAIKAGLDLAIARAKLARSLGGS